MATLEEGYGINLLPLATFAMDTYKDDPCTLFRPRLDAKSATLSEKQKRLVAQMHKAITILQFKLEGQLIDQRPDWGMKERRVLERIDFAQGTYGYEGSTYPLLDRSTPTNSRPRTKTSWRNCITRSASRPSCRSTSSACCSTAACMPSATATCSSTPLCP